MASDLETGLIDGGLSPAAAKLISNAIENAATPRVNRGRNLSDATPASAMRMINADSRRYLFTNLDYASGDQFRERLSAKGEYRYPSKAHPYQDSQPATANPTLNTPGVRGGDYVSVASQTTNDVSQARVGLAVQARGGDHARLDPATGKINAVPISIEFEPKGLLDGEVVEEQGRTVIRIRFVDPIFAALADKRIGKITEIDLNNTLTKGILYVDGAAVASGVALVLMPD